MSIGLAKQNESLLDKVWVLLTWVMIIYMIFIQYAIKPYSGVMIILCVGIIFCGLIQIFVIQRGVLKKSVMWPFLVFVFGASITTILITSHGLYGTDLAIRMIEYILTAYSIYLLLRKSPQYIYSLLWCVCISSTLLGVKVLTSGVSVTSAGGIGLESLNINTMSSFFLFMFFCSFYLFERRRKRSQAALILFMDVLVFVSQILSASRRGFIIIVMFFALSITFAVIPYRGGKKSIKSLVSYLFLIIVASIALMYFKYYILDKTVLGARLLGNFTGGDAARAKYQEYAWEQAISHPILGIGLGGVAYGVGLYSHSLYYEIFSCTGFILSAFLLGGLARLGLDCMKIYMHINRYDSASSVEYIIKISFFYWISLLISGVAVVMIYEPYFYISIAILSATIKNMSDLATK